MQNNEQTISDGAHKNTTSG